MAPPSLPPSLRVVQAVDVHGVVVKLTKIALPTFGTACAKNNCWIPDKRKTLRDVYYLRHYSTFDDTFFFFVTHTVTRRGVRAPTHEMCVCVCVPLPVCLTNVTPGVAGWQWRRRCSISPQRSSAHTHTHTRIHQVGLLPLYVRYNILTRRQKRRRQRLQQHIQDVPESFSHVILVLGLFNICHWKIQMAIGGGDETGFCWHIL